MGFDMELTVKSAKFWQNPARLSTAGRIGRQGYAASPFLPALLGERAECAKQMEFVTVRDQPVPDDD
jgi:hypothetical protein